MYAIGDTWIEEDLASALFACDLASCQGACCTLPGCRGAPLADHETDILTEIYPIVRTYLPEKHQAYAERTGLFEGRPGDYATTSVGQRECVFVYYDNAIARCALERAFLDGKTTWKKPISCHLFPIRVSPGPVPHLRYEQIAECRSGRLEGASKGIPVLEFLREPLTRVYGRQWYDRLRQEMHRMTRSSLTE